MPRRKCKYSDDDIRAAHAVYLKTGKVMHETEGLVGICKPVLRKRFLELGLEVRTHKTHRGLVLGEEKYCGFCDKWKLLTEFRPDERYMGGVKHYCLACESRHRKARYLTQGIYGNVRINYNLGREEYDALMAAADGKCNICGGSNPDGRRLHVEHCHATGIVRGIVCTRCNTGIARFLDSPELLRKAAEYLERAYARAANNNVESAASAAAGGEA